MSVNKVILVGNLGKDPEIRSTKDGKEIANFSLATSERWKNKQGEQQEKTEWHRVTVFGGLVQIVKSYVKKGSKLYIEGTLQTRKWQDKSGNDKYTTEIILQGFGGVLQLLNKVEGRQTQNEYDQTQPEIKPAQSFESEELDDSIPF